MRKLIYTQGLPASGKTTRAKEWVNENPRERVRVNRDDIRRMLGPYWIPQREDLVTSIENSMIVEALHSGFDVVVDATNFRNPERRFGLLLEQYSFENVSVVCWDEFLQVPVSQCIKRDLEREHGQVGITVILNMYHKYLYKNDIPKIN